MCRVFANQPVASYEPETRSIRLAGHATSIRLERAFWDILEEIAAREGVTLPRFLNALHDEVLEFHGECANFASLVRCSCLKYAGENRAKAGPASLENASRRSDAPARQLDGPLPLHQPA